MIPCSALLISPSAAWISFKASAPDRFYLSRSGQAIKHLISRFLLHLLSGAQSLVVVIDCHRQDLFCLILSDYILIQKLLNLCRYRQFCFFLCFKREGSVVIRVTAIFFQYPHCCHPSSFQTLLTDEWTCCFFCRNQYTHFIRTLTTKTTALLIGGNFSICWHLFYVNKGSQLMSRKPLYLLAIFIFYENFDS